MIRELFMCWLDSRLMCLSRIRSWKLATENSICSCGCHHATIARATYCWQIPPSSQRCSAVMPVCITSGRTSRLSKVVRLAQIRNWILLAGWVGILMMRAHAQNRGVYPLGMSATNSGVTPHPGFTYANQLLFYSRDHAKDDGGQTLSVTGENYVLMDMNTLAWVSKKTFVGGARYSAAASLPFAKNSLTSDVQGRVSGGGGFADSYYMPFILGWNRERIAIRAIYGFLAPTGRFVVNATDNVGSGYWTHALSSGQTIYLTSNKRLVLSVFQMYEFHTTQEGTAVRPGDTIDLDYSLLGGFPMRDVQFQIGLVGYEQRQAYGLGGCIQGALCHQCTWVRGEL